MSLSYSILFDLHKRQKKGETFEQHDTYLENVEIQGLVVWPVGRGKGRYQSLHSTHISWDV